MWDPKKGLDISGMVRENKTIEDLTNEELVTIATFTELTNAYYYLIHDEVAYRLKHGSRA